MFVDIVSFEPCTELIELLLTAKLHGLSEQPTLEQRAISFIVDITDIGNAYLSLNI